MSDPPGTSNESRTIRILEAWPWVAALQNQQLLPEAKIICDQQYLRPDGRSNRPQQTYIHLSPFVGWQEVRSMLSMRKACGLQFCALQADGA